MQFIYLVSLEIPPGDNLLTLKCGRGAQNSPPTNAKYVNCYSFWWDYL